MQQKCLINKYYVDPCWLYQRDTERTVQYYFLVGSFRCTYLSSFRFWRCVDRPTRVAFIWVKGNFVRAAQVLVGLSLWLFVRPSNAQLSLHRWLSTFSQLVRGEKRQVLTRVNRLRYTTPVRVVRPRFLLFCSTLVDVLCLLSISSLREVYSFAPYSVAPAASSIVWLAFLFAARLVETSL